jgi:hypothetical protein
MATRTLTYTTNPATRIKKEYKALTADYTVTAADSGLTFLLDATGEAITLPAVAEGLNFKFLCTAAVATSSWTITAATKVISGSAQVAGAVVAAELEDVISLVHTSKATIGDWVSVESDGTNWYVEGSAVTAGSITFTGAA